MGVAGALLMVALIVVDALPAQLEYVIIGIMFGMLAITSILLARRRPWKRVIGVIFALIFMLVFGSIAYYLAETYATMNKISENNTSINTEMNIGKHVDPATEPFNLYITGIDQWETEKGLDLERSDVNMIVTVNPVTKKILLTSIPRDSYVKLHTAQQMDKLTHTGVYGVDETINTVSDWLGIDINYYVKMNFTAVRDIINAMGGIRVYSPVAFDSSLRDYHYDKGWNDLGGREALFFARERHAFEGQDSVRVENQQAVMKAIIKKMTSSTTLLTKYGDIMSAAGNNLSTNMSSEEMQALVRMQVTDLASWDVETQKIEGEYGMGHVASLSSRNMYSIYITSEESVASCLDAIDKITNPSEEELEAAEKSRNQSFLENFSNMIKEKMEEEKEKRLGEKDTEE